MQGVYHGPGLPPGLEPPLMTPEGVTFLFFTFLFLQEPWLRRFRPTQASRQRTPRASASSPLQLQDRKPLWAHTAACPSLGVADSLLTEKGRVVWGPH